MHKIYIPPIADEQTNETLADVIYNLDNAKLTRFVSNANVILVPVCNSEMRLDGISRFAMSEPCKANNNRHVIYYDIQNGRNLFAQHNSDDALLMLATELNLAIVQIPKKNSRP